MGFKDDVRANMLTQVALRANNEAELEKGMQQADALFNGVCNVLGEIGKALFSDGQEEQQQIQQQVQQTQQTQTQQTSSEGNIGGKLLTGAVVAGAVAGGAYLANKYLNNDDNDNDKQENNAINNTTHLPKRVRKQIQNENNKIQKKNNLKLLPFKEDFDRIDVILEKPRKSNEGLKKELKKLENRINQQHNKVAMNKIAEYYKKIRCDSDAERCYQKAATFN